MQTQQNTWLMLNIKLLKCLELNPKNHAAGLCISVTTGFLLDVFLAVDELVLSQ